MTDENIELFKQISVGIKEDFARFLFIYVLMEMEVKNEKIRLLEMELEREDLDDDDDDEDDDGSHIILNIQDKPEGFQ